MSINLSDLTSPNNQDVLAEITSAADFLDPIGKLENLSRSPNKGGHALQTTALNQPRALPLVNGEGYLYLSGVTGNYASVPDESALDVTGDITLECDFLLAEFPPTQETVLAAKYNTNGSQRSYQIRVEPTGNVRIILSEDGLFNGSFDKSQSFASELTGGTRATVKASWRQSDGRLQFFIKESDGSFTQVGADQNLLASGIYNGTSNLEIGSHNEGAVGVGDAVGVFGAKIYASVDGTNKVLDVDFTATNVRHGATKFACATGQVVTINKSGNDPATIIKKPVLRFDGANSGLNGLFANNIDGGYMFAAFSVLGDGGADWGRVFTTNLVGSGTDYSGAGAGFSLRSADTTNLLTITQGLSQSMGGMFDAANGDILHEVKLEGSDFSSKVNNAGFLSATHSNTIDSDRFNIGQDFTQFVTQNGAIDLEFLALFSADSVPDEATASKIRNYINNRNNVFDLKDGFGYYFYDAQNAPVGNISSGSASWNGRIVGSDNGDTDKLATQATANDQPVGDGYVVTFADNSDFLTIPSTAQAGWQVVGTSLGTFAYRVNNTAVTELNLLGNFGHASFRKAGNLYGIILLPESASAADIEAARKLLIDRGAADGTTLGSIFANWYDRDDIVEFKHINTSSVTYAEVAWFSCGNLVSFPALDLNNCANLVAAWQFCSSLSDFGAIQAPLCSNFTSAWKSCSSLQSFPAGAKLGTSASNVNFTDAWRDSGLTSFPALDLSNATRLDGAWRGCNFMLSFGLVNTSSVTRFDDAWLGCVSLTSFPLIDTSSGTRFYRTWYDMDSVTDFPLLNVSAGRYFNQAWRFCVGLINFPANFFDTWNPSSISSGVFNFAWTGCTSLTAQSVENILTSIDASGKYATTNGASGGTALADAGIDIDYNVATGSLSAATNAAVTSLKAKGWVIVVNNVTL